MAVVSVCCPDCSTKDVVKNGKTHNDKQRYLCQNDKCKVTTFIINYSYNAYLPGVKEQILEMTMNGSGIRDISRVLSISTNTISKEIKKKPKKFNSSISKRWSH
jgi:transposase-like protein